MTDHKESMQNPGGLDSRAKQDHMLLVLGPDCRSPTAPGFCMLSARFIAPPWRIPTPVAIAFGSCDDALANQKERPHGERADHPL